MLQKYHELKRIANADCQQFDKTMDHIMSACPLLAKQQYIKTQDRVCAQHFKLCLLGNRGKITNEHWYESASKLAETRYEGNVIILWNQHVPTNRTIPNNKPDIIIYENEKGRYVSINVANSGGRCVIKKDITIEIQCMWNVKT